MSVDTPGPVHLRRPGGGRIVLRCLSYLRPHRALVVGAYLLLLINNGITLAMPLIIGHTVDQGIRAGNESVIRWGAVALLGLALLRGVFTFLSGRWTEVASQNVAYDLRNAIHGKLQSLSFSYHDKAETGQLLARAIGDVDRIRFLTGRAILRLVEVVTLVLGIAIAMMVMNVRLALPTLVIVPSRIVKAFAQEPAEIRRFDRANARFFDLHMIASRTRAMYLPLLRLIASAGTIVVILYGGQLVIREELTIGELVAFSTYVGQLLVPVRRLGMIVSAIAQSIASGERIFEILDARSEVEDLPGARSVEGVRGHVRFEHVSFSYFERNPVLKDIDFEAKPGQVVALLGATGSGKSSIINLVPRFYDPTKGRILLDGHDICDLTVASLREQIGIVLQDTTLFATTVRENIAFGRPDASEEEIIAAARAASAHDFIMEMPQGYETAVGERGMTLSGGQKQRIAIARAILKDPRILILDDATSSVDTETEALIQAALARLMKGRTSFVIAQRLSTLRQADQVLVIEKGRIAARGYRTAEHTAHDELLRTSGLYAEIYYQQLRPRELDGRLRKDDST